MANLTLSLFGDDEPEPECEALDVTPDVTPVPVNFSHPFSDDEKSTDPEAVCPSLPDDHHVLAFVACCRAAQIEHPALTPESVGTILSGNGKQQLPGRRAYDRAACSRLANLILRGVESDVPRVAPERWREAGQAAPAWWAGRQKAEVA